MEKNAPTYFPELREVLRADLYPLATGGGDGRHHARTSSAPAASAPASAPTCSSAARRASRSRSRGSGSTGSATASTRPPACCRRTRGCSPRPKPRFFILENVYALTFNNKASQPAFERLAPARSRQAGYQFHWQVLNAADYGVPQARPRLFIVGCTQARAAARAPRADAPRPVGAPQDRGRAAPPRHHRRGARRPRRTEPEPEEVVRGRWGHLLPEIPPGENYLHYTAERGHPDPLFEWRSRYWSFLLKLDPDRPVADDPGPARARTSVRSTGRTVGSECPSCAASSRSPTTTRSSARRLSVQAQIGNSRPAAARAAGRRVRSLRSSELTTCQQVARATAPTCRRSVGSAAIRVGSSGHGVEIARPPEAELPQAGRREQARGEHVELVERVLAAGAGVACLLHLDLEVAVLVPLLARRLALDEHAAPVGRA